MKHVFIINPTISAKKIEALKKQIDTYMVGKDVYIEATQSSGHAQFLAQKYAKFDKEPSRIYICGGDGMVHECINGVVGSSNVEVAILPMGTGNDFVKSFEDYTRDDFLDLSNYELPEYKMCDVLQVNGEYAMNTISFGYDVQVARYANAIKRKITLKGMLPYNMGMVAQLFKPLGESFQIQIDDQPMIQDTYMFVVFCNGKYYGGGYKPCVTAKMDDGLIDVCLIKNINRKEILRLANDYKKGTHEKYTDKVRCEKAKVIHMNTNNEVIYANLDGEVREMKNPTIEVVPKAIRLVLPKKQGD